MRSSGDFNTHLFRSSDEHILKYLLQFNVLKYLGFLLVTESRILLISL